MVNAPNPPLSSKRAIPTGSAGASPTVSLCRHTRARGNAVIEVSFLLPWLFFMFIGVLDVGFYCQAAIATQNAARAGAAYTSLSSTTAADSTVACQYALQELQAMTNVRNLANCNGSPLTVTAAKVTGPDGAWASSVTVTYVTNRMVPIPGLMSQFTIRRIVQMKLK